MVRLAGALVAPFRLLGAFLATVSLALLGGKDATPGVAMLVAGIGLLVAARLLRDLRWPALPRYLRDPANQQRPRDWRPDPDRSDSNLAWSLVRPVVEPWIQAHRNPLHRAMGRSRRDVLQGRTGTTAAAPLDRIGLVDLAGPSDALSRRLSPDDVAVARTRGVLPPWFWEELADQVTAR